MTVITSRIGSPVVTGLTAITMFGALGTQSLSPISYKSEVVQITADYSSACPRVSYSHETSDRVNTKREVPMLTVDAGLKRPQAVVMEQPDQKNGAVEAMRILQEAMQGEAERAGLTAEEDVIALVRELRNTCEF